MTLLSMKTRRKPHRLVTVRPLLTVIGKGAWKERRREIIELKMNTDNLDGVVSLLIDCEDNDSNMMIDSD